MVNIDRDKIISYLEMYRIYLENQQGHDESRPCCNTDEEYKREIIQKATIVLATESWNEASIGTGVIGECAIKAVQQNKNLVGKFQVSTFIETVRQNLLKAERLLFDLYHEHKEEECFEQICGLFGRKYDLIAYLYFVLDPYRYLPLRSNIFDDIFKKLRIDFQMSGHCSWNNYQEFLTIIAIVRDVMMDYFQIEDIDLLDVHSFLWTLNTDAFVKEQKSSDPKAAFAKKKVAESGETVIHKDYGEGIVTKITEENIYVEFGEKKRIFPYPKAFSKGYLQWVNQDNVGISVPSTKTHKDILVGSPSWFVENAKRPEKLEYEKNLYELRMNFQNRFSPPELVSLSGQDLLLRVFGDGDTMLALLTERNSKYRIFGSTGQYKYLQIIYIKNHGSWNYCRNNQPVPVSEEQAEEHAIEIRDLLVKGAKAIESIGLFDSISDYEKLGKEFDKIYFSRYTWALKYYQMMYPRVFPGMYADSTLKRAIRILGLSDHGNNRLLNMGEVALYIKQCGIDNIIFNSIYADQWTWDEEREPSEYAQSRLKS